MPFILNEEHELLKPKNIFYPLSNYIIKKKNNIFFPVEKHHTGDDQNLEEYLTHNELDRFDFSIYQKNISQLSQVKSLDANNHYIFNSGEVSDYSDGVSYETCMNKLVKYNKLKTQNINAFPLDFIKEFGENSIFLPNVYSWSHRLPSGLLSYDFKGRRLTNVVTDPNKPGSLVTLKYLNEHYYKQGENVQDQPYFGHYSSNVKRNPTAIATINNMWENYESFRCLKEFRISKLDDEDFSYTFTLPYYFALYKAPEFFHNIDIQFTKEEARVGTHFEDKLKEALAQEDSYVKDKFYITKPNFEKKGFDYRTDKIEFEFPYKDAKDLKEVKFEDNNYTKRAESVKYEDIKFSTTDQENNDKRIAQELKYQFPLFHVYKPWQPVKLKFNQETTEHIKNKKFEVVVIFEIMYFYFSDIYTIYF